MPSLKKKYIAAGLIAAGSTAAVTAYATRRRRDKAVDKELEGMLDQAEIPAVRSAPKAQTLAVSTAAQDAAAEYQDLMGAEPVTEAKSTPA